MTREELNEILKLHKMWLKGKGGKRANLSNTDLSNTDLSDTDLSHVDLNNTDLSNTYLGCANLSCANLRHANLSHANLNGANLSFANLNGANLNGANLSSANLNYTNLSNTTGLISPIDYLDKNFEKTEEGYIVYKTFGVYYDIPNSWEIKPNCIIEEEVNYNRSNNCGCGINVATKKWIEKDNAFIELPIWKLLIKWEWLPYVVVPYNTDGTIRCGKAMLLEVVNE